MSTLLGDNLINKKTVTTGTTSIGSTWPGGGEVTKVRPSESGKASRSFLIVKNLQICGGEPTIEGTRISVTNIVELRYGLGWNVQKIIDGYPSLGEEQIKAALEYYESHPKEIDDYLQEEREIDA